MSVLIQVIVAVITSKIFIANRIMYKAAITHNDIIESIANITLLYFSV